MRAVVFLENNPNVVEGALERNPHHLLTARKSRCMRKRKERNEFLFFKHIIVSKYLRFLFIFAECLEYLEWKIRGRKVANIKENNRSKC